MQIAGGLVAGLRGLTARWRRVARVGGNDVEDARMLADLERGAGEHPRGSEWLDNRTIEDLDLGQVFAAIDRTRTASGAQVLWRWLVAPTLDPALLAARERKLALLAEPALREHVTRRLGNTASADAPLLPNLLWAPAPPPLHRNLIRALACALLCFGVLARLWSPALIGLALVFVANVFVDDWSKLRLAHQALALEALDDVLQRSLALLPRLPLELRAGIEADLAPRAALHRRQRLLKIHDPFGLFDLVRAGLLLRIAVGRSCMRIVEAERARLRRVVLWFGELDALAAIATLRVERPDLCVPEVQAGPPRITARALAHPAIAKPIGNDVELAESGLLVTGDNMSGKSTFLRTIAVNAILAQSIHTTWGIWSSSFLRVRTVMRIADEPARQLSTYAVEVAAMGELLAEVRGEAAILFVLDEPFHGTSPTIRVPIVIAVLEYLVTMGLAVAATHDLDVANRLGSRFARGYFQDDGSGTFDRRLRAGIAPGTNAVEILRRAGYPDDVLANIARYT